jgi:hypothetical protein
MDGDLVDSVYVELGNYLDFAIPDMNNCYSFFVVYVVYWVSKLLEESFSFLLKNRIHIFELDTVGKPAADGTLSVHGA